MTIKRVLLALLLGFAFTLPVAAEAPPRRSDLLLPSGVARDLAGVDLAQLVPAEPSAAEPLSPLTPRVETQQAPRPASPTYQVPRGEIEKRGANSLADVLRSQPGFAINDYGPGADIHTGTYYRGASINQSAILLNGRPYGNNVSTYHGTTDFNSIPTEVIDRVELSSGSAATLYGSQAFGGVINIVTRKGQGPPRFRAALEYGNLSQAGYRLGYGGTSGDVSYNFGFQSYGTDNRYPVPVGAANRDPQTGLLYNADTFFSSYYASASLELDPRNTLDFDFTKSLSRRGLVYFGFPLQNDRLNRDGTNVGFGWKTLLGGGEDSVLKVNLGYNQEFFNTYSAVREGSLDTQLLSARIEHSWSTAANNSLRYGFDLLANRLNGDALSTIQSRLVFNGADERSLFNGSLFVLDTWSITPEVQLELGFRENLNSQFASTFHPSGGIRWRVAPGITLRGSWVALQRNPGLDQLYFFDTVHGWLPNGDLRPETGSSWTAGLDTQFGPDLTGQFTYFGNLLNNRLNPVALGNGLSQWQNVGTVNTSGGEAALRWRIDEHWSTALSYTYTDARILTGPDAGLQFGLIPYSVGQLGISYQNEGWQLNLFTNYNSGSRRALYTLSTDRSTDFSPAYLTVDLRAKVPVTPNLGLTIALDNLADTVYEKVNRIYLPGLIYRIGVESSF